MPRQGHKKSRNGCSRCKTRKVKCDEVRPICGGCHAHPELCVYTGEPGPQSTSSGTPSDPPAGVSPPYLVDHSFDLDSDQQRRLELILMSHWCRVTIYTLPGIASVNLLLRECLDEAIELAMTHSFLLNTFLSLSALHLVVEPKHAVGSNHEFDFARVHRIYLNKALAEQRVALMNIDSENAAALYWTTVLLNYVPLRLLPEDYTKSEWSPPTQWITMSAAIAQVYVTVRPMLMGGRTLTYVEMSALPIFLDPYVDHIFAAVDHAELTSTLEHKCLISHMAVPSESCLLLMTLPRYSTLLHQQHMTECWLTLQRLTSD